MALTLPDTFKYEKRGQIAVMTINRPEALNSFTREMLVGIRGIGPWTINYTLLRGFASVDGSLHGDVAVRRGLQKLLGRSEKIDADEAEAWLARFTPWRALVAAHLWAG